MTETLLHPSQLSLQNPWPGLRPFTESDREFFFGRERETAELLSLVQRATVVVLYGQSGLGKTSLLQAGVFPHLKRLDCLPFRLRLDHSEDSAPFACQIKDVLASQLDGAGVNGPRPGASETLWEYFHRRDVDFWGPRNRLLTPVIVLDQFEEMFTLGQRTENAISRVTQFAKELEALLEHRPPQAMRERLDIHPEDGLQFDFQRQAVKFVLSLREDFLPHLDTWRTRMPSLLPHRFRLEPMTGQQALDVVQRAGRELVEPDVAHDIVDFVSSSQRRRLVRVMEQREVEPALLSVICDELNRRRLDRNQTRITADLLSGEREAIIQSFYERSFDGVDHRVRDWIEDELLTASGYRDRGALEDAVKLGLPEGAFDQLVDRRILHREEREGVVWLELTHDLLSDPAAQSRTVRVQRRQAEATAKREAEYADELRRTRALVAVFAVLLLVAGIALIVAFNSRRLAKAAAAKAQVSQQAALAAQAGAERSSAEATRNAKVAFQAREEAENSLQKAQRNFETALGVTEELGLNPLEQTSRDLRVPTATVLNIIRSADKSYQQLAADAGSSATVNEQHAHFLAKAADVLFQTGHIKEGFENARKAVKLLEELKTPRVSGERLPHTQAEVYYVHGKGLLANGHVSQARADFEHALNLAAALASSMSRDKHEIDRVHVLSEIALGEAATKAFAFAPANAHFDQALNFIGTNRLKGSEADSWRALALRGKGLSQIEDAEALRLFAEANNIVRGLMDREPENLRWQRLSAELAYRQGFSAYRLSKTEEAASFFESSRTGSENLCGRDSDNLDWRLILAQTRRGLGLVYQARSESGRAKEVLEKVLGDANTISHAQPAWSQASFMRVLALMDLGDLHSESDLVKAWDYFTRAHQASQDFVKKAREYLEFYRVLALSIGKQGVIRDNQHRGEEALKLYQEAIQSLQPLDPLAQDSPDTQADRAWYYSNMGDALRKLKRTREAISSYDKAVKIWAEEARRDPNKPSSYRGLSVAYTFCGDAYLEAKDLANASAQYDLASQAISKAVTIRPEDTEFLRQKAFVNGRISDLWFGEADLKRSLTALKEAVDGVWTALHYDSSNKTLNEDLSFYRKRAEKIKSAIQGDPPSTNSGRGRLTAQQSEDLLGSIQKLVAKSNNLELLVAQPSWEVQSLMAGAWRVLAPSEPESKTARQRLSALNERLTPDQIVGTRKLPLDFYDNATLYESEILQENGQHGIITYVQRGTETVLLDGTSPPIHKMNEKSPPKLDTPERASAYLRFFVGAIQGDEGRFMLLDRLDDIRWRSRVPAKQRSDAAKKIGPLVVEMTPGGGWQAIGTIQYSNALFATRLGLRRNGSVEMNEDEPLAADLAVFVERFVNGIRIMQTLEEARLANTRERLKLNPNDMEALRQLPRLYSDLKRWKEAVEAQQKWVEFVHQQSEKDSKMRETLPGSYTSLAWYQLFVRDFGGALASSEAGLKLDESNLPLQTNRAHALLFLGRDREAEAIYLQHRGKKIRANSDKKWEETVLEDFDALKKEGITRPEITRIQKLLTPESK